MDELAQIISKLKAPRPRTIVQEPYDHGPAVFKRLCIWQTNMPNGDDLAAYARDLFYADNIQPDLFRYLLPACLQAWRANLVGADGGTYNAFSELFFPALHRRRLLQQFLPPPDAALADEFVRLAIVQLIGSQTKLVQHSGNDSLYRWLGALNSYAVVFSPIDQLWHQWWNLNSLGYSIGVVQYVSLLLYKHDTTPLFPPWTPQQGGGPPLLNETDAHFYNVGWQPCNLQFITSTLTPDYAQQRLQAAVGELTDPADRQIAARIADDSIRLEGDLRAGISQLPTLLADVSSVHLPDE